MSWSRSKAFARTRSRRLKICVPRGLGGFPSTSAWGYLDSHRHRLRTSFLKNELDISNATCYYISGIYQRYISLICCSGMLYGCYKESGFMTECSATQNKILEIGKKSFLLKVLGGPPCAVSLRKLALLRGRFMDIIRTKQRFLRRWSPSLQMV